MPEELDDLLFDEEDYRETGAKQSDIITAKANVCLREISLLTELAEVRRQKKVLMKALGESVPDTPDSSQVLGTTRRSSRHNAAVSGVGGAKNAGVGKAGGGGGSPGPHRKRSSVILDSIMSIIMVDSKSKEGDTFDAVGVGSSAKRPSVSLATEKLV